MNVSPSSLATQWSDLLALLEPPNPYKESTAGLERVSKEEVAANTPAHFALNNGAPTYEVAQQTRNHQYAGWRVSNTAMTGENAFINFKREPRNGQGHSVGDKFHLSVEPKDVPKAYGIISKILNAQDSPIDSWKMTDLSRLVVQGASDERVSSGAQFTIYAKPDRADDTYSPQYMGKVRGLVQAIEEALQKAGIGQSSHKPASDVAADHWQYVTYRNENRSQRQGSAEQSDQLRQEPFFKLASFT